MTKEALEKEADVYFKSICEDYNEEYERTGKRHYFVGFDIKNAYLASAEPREKRIADLEAQIDKMKCCGNCNKLRGRFDSKTNINILYCTDSDMKQIEVGFQMCCCKWEIKEK